MDSMHCRTAAGFRLRFEPLVEGEPAVDVPCDAAGRVDLGQLDDRVRSTYLYARAVRGLRLAAPVVMHDAPCA